jgi:3-oxoacyl-[acyl-carrier-protein] synthase-3
MEGAKVFRHAVYRMADAARTVLADLELSPEDVDWIVPHQANQRILDAISGELRVPAGRVFSHVKNYANTGAASVVLALADMLLHKMIAPEQQLLSMAFGDGLSWGSALWKVASLPTVKFLGRDM